VKQEKLPLPTLSSSTRWPKVKGQNDQQRSTKHGHKTKDRTRTPLKTGDELSVGRGSFSCFTSHWLHYIMNNVYDDGVEVNQIVCCIYWCLHWSNRPRMDMSPHLNTLSWFRSNQSLLLLLNAVCLTGKHQIPRLGESEWLFFIYCV
jgi:hypothetical protein